MPVNRIVYQALIKELSESGAMLVAVSKLKSPQDILAMYELGQRDFGENYVQELTEKQAQLPPDIRWHFIGHLQSNKIKQIIPFVHLIHGVDSLKLLKEINKQAAKINRIVYCLLQVHIAQEETKYGFDQSELKAALNDPELASLPNIQITGLMGMASFSEDMNKVRAEFRQLKALFDNCSNQSGLNWRLTTLSMGMSADYAIALEEGSNLVRVGSLLFGPRTYP
jgi:PLP dependent protein